jgi:hypothetical protein
LKAGILRARTESDRTQEKRRVKFYAKNSWGGVPWHREERWPGLVDVRFTGCLLGLEPVAWRGAP